MSAMKSLSIIILLSLSVGACKGGGGGGGFFLPEGKNVNKTWHNPSSLDDHISAAGRNVGGAGTFQVAMDSHGNAIIVWTQSDGTSDNVYKSEYRGGVWSHPSSTGDYVNVAGQSAGSPQAAMDNNGNAIVAFWQFDGGTKYPVYKSEYRNGVWIHPSGTNEHISDAGQDTDKPQAAMDDNGNAIITWVGYDGGQYIYKSEYRGGVWTHPSGTSDHISLDGQNADNPQVAMDNNGNAIIAWQQSDGATTQIYISEYRDDDGDGTWTWTSPSSLADHISVAGRNASYPRVAMDNNGEAVITWFQYIDGVYRQVFKSEYRGGSWSHPSSLSDYISIAGQDSRFSQIAMDNNGNAIITWEQHDGTTTQIYKSEYRGGIWTHPSGTSDHISIAGRNAAVPQVAMGDNGSAIIAWQQYDGANYQIYKGEYRSGAWTNPSSLDDHVSIAGEDAFSPLAAMGDNGNAIITWYQGDGATDQIYKSEYR